MNDVFLSYHSSDQAIAQRFADTLEAEGLSVWWDREIPVGKSFDEVIEQQLTSARCVVVLWSNAAVRSRWVRTEASAAASRDRLVPALIEHAKIPLEFRQIQTAQLQGWNGDREHPELELLLAAVREHVEAAKRGETGSSVSQLTGSSASHVPTLPAIAARPEIGPDTRRPSRRRIGRAAVALVAAAVIAGAAFTLLQLREDDESALDTRSVATDPGSDDQANVAEERPVRTEPAAQTGPRPVPPAAGTVPLNVELGAFPIAVGDRIEEGVPAPGAGSIDAPYERDVYAFTAAPGERVYFRLLDFESALTGITWALSDELGSAVFSACFGCAEPGATRLTAGGRYTLTVGSDTNRATGTYRLRLFSVPPPSRFRIEVGDAIGQGIPSDGAGAIESPGAEDVFSFAAAAGQRVYFRMRSYSEGLGGIRWRLVDEDDVQVFDTCLGCSEPGVAVLRKGGEYTLTVGNPANPSTGTYELQLLEVAPPQEFDLALPARVRQGAPSPGAGLIESPGAQDIYRFTAEPGETVRFSLLEQETGMSFIEWRLLDDLGMELFEFCFGCSSPGAIRLTRGGVYTLIVGHTSNPATGAYAFEIGR